MRHIHFCHSFFAVLHLNAEQRGIYFVAEAHKRLRIPLIYILKCSMELAAVFGQKCAKTDRSANVQINKRSYVECVRGTVGDGRYY